MSDFETYPEANQKPKANWRKIRESFANGFGRVFGMSVATVSVLSILGLAFFGITSCVARDEQYYAWAYECRAAGSMVAEVSGPDICLSGVKVEKLRDNWGNFDGVACVNMGGIEAYLGRDILCFIGKVESRQP